MRIILLHGLARTSRSLRRMANAVSAAGHQALLVDYPSRSAPLVELAARVYDKLLEQDFGPADDVGFVTQSMGGLVVRAIAAVDPSARFGRSVFLGCPINGSLLASRLGNQLLARSFYGPALADLAPDEVDKLPPPPCTFGVVAGSNWHPLMPGGMFVRAWAPGSPSDSTVLIAETQSPHMIDHVTIPAVHSAIPDSAQARRHVIHFLAHGRFKADAEEKAS